MKLSQPVPILRILDEAKAREFYVEFLGFAIDWEHRFAADLPLYLQVSRDGCVIHLSEHYGDCNSGGAIRIETGDVAGLHRELSQKRYKFARPGIESTPWQTREMCLTDPFGNRLIFFEAGSASVAEPGLAARSTLTPVGSTAQWVAANRALETESPEPLYRDPFARALAGEAGFAMLGAMRAAIGLPMSSAADPYLTIRTRYFDDALREAVRDESVRQVVILASGMDTRAFRLEWPEDLVLFEVDRDDVFDYKEPLLGRTGQRPRCDRRVVRADLTHQWTAPLLAAGFDPARPSAILAEGLVIYLEALEVTSLLSSMRGIACTDSWLGLDLANQALLEASFLAPYKKRLADAGCPWKFAVEDPETWLASHGWLARAVTLGAPEATYGRWPYPVPPSGTANTPATCFVQARAV
ncbi:MAG: SAM-dependent methyltransferase [Acidobacteriota bacterium]